MTRRRYHHPTRESPEPDSGNMVRISSVGSSKVIALLVVAIATGTHLIFRPSPRSKHTTILEIFARCAFDWVNSTTPAPLSSTAVLVKTLLADRSTAPPELARAAATRDDLAGNVLDVAIAGVRDFVSSRILEDVKCLCDSAGGCDPNEVDPEFGIRPLHVAQFWGSADLVDYLTSIGASQEVYDAVGRQPRNLTFPTFSKYSKMVGRRKLSPDADPQERCEIPEVIIPLSPHQIDSIGFEATEVAWAKWRREAEAALSEVRRLSSEGEPVMVRNILQWLTSSVHGADGSMSLRYGDASSFVRAWGHRAVDVGRVPYAKVFNMANKRTTLKEYYTTDRAEVATTERNASSVSTIQDFEGQLPRYVFQADTEACLEGRELLGRVVAAALPSSGDQPLICPPMSGLRGLESVHYYLGQKGTGAPHHVHSDALNLVVTGKKRWWVVTPRNSVWSKRHILELADEGNGGPWKEPIVGDSGTHPDDWDEENDPMECVQDAGDLVYVPADWGHAVMNLEDDTFG